VAISMAITMFERGLSDEEVVSRVLGGETAIFEILMRRYNQLVYRSARMILREDTEAEDVMQEAYVRAYQNLHQFAGRAKFSTWITRIAINEALARKRRGKLYQEPEPMSGEKNQTMDRFESSARTPEQHTYLSETHLLLERAIESLPEIYRTVFVMRDVEDADTTETAAALDITEETVKTRLHRARMLLRKQLFAQIGSSSKEVFAFDAIRCDRVVKNVFERIQEIDSKKLTGDRPVS
jgi:RNA polymerase sigma-70 factor, ECF subfamily